MLTEKNPTGSNFRIRGFLYSFCMIAVANMPAIPTGTLTSKIRGQLKLSTRYPPINGPKETEAADAIDQNPRASVRFSGGNSLVMIAIPTGIRAPAPNPWMTREKISIFSDEEYPQRKDPKVKRKSPRKYTRLYPKRSAIQPEVGNITARASI